jgi:hypothetical protein
VRNALIDAVERGTARQIRGAFIGSNGDAMIMGGKTGTGDNRFEAYGESRVINRTAAFVFFIGDRFFGIITTYVPGAAAACHRFTSSLPVKVLKMLSPGLKPLIQR